MALKPGPNNVVPFRRPTGGGPRFRMPAFLPPLWKTATGWLMVANTAVWLVMVVLSLGGGIVTSFPGATLDRFGANVPALVPDEPWRLVASVFLHGNLMHILFNMGALWFWGPRLEAAFGRARFAVLYLGAGIAGSLLSFGWHLLIGGAGVGASGAIMGVLGALFALSWKAAGWNA